MGNKGTLFRLETRHNPSGLNSYFTGAKLGFSDYVACTRHMLSDAYSRSGYGNVEKRVDGNAPFELWPENYQSGDVKPFKRGVLLTHGLTDSPYFMRYLAKFFQQNGWRVMAILLPGHGTQPGDLLNMNYREWIKSVAYGVGKLNDEVDEIYLAGLSTGATLNLLQCIQDRRICGLFLFSPALRISRRAAWANVHKLYSWLLPSAKWLNIQPDLDIYKYESFPKNAAYQTYSLTKKLRSQMRKYGLNVPVFAAASEDDVTVESRATLEFMAGLRHPSSRLVYYKSDPSVPPPGIEGNKVETVGSVVPEQHIVSFSHLSVVLPQDDEHYGRHGEYSNCQHYYPEDLDKYNACIGKSQNISQGEVTEKNLAAGIMRRLMYNPHFNELEISMQRFIDSLP